MFFRRSDKDTDKPKDGGAKLRALVKQHLPAADEDTLEIVYALAGLIACVAYADRKFDAVEEERAREALASVEGLSAQGARAICDLLREHAPQIATVNPQAYTRSLRERGSVELRRELLELLLDLAAADGELSLSETDLLRRTTAAMGLDPQDYSAAQEKHRDKLALLR